MIIWLTTLFRRWGVCGAPPHSSSGQTGSREGGGLVQPKKATEEEAERMKVLGLAQVQHFGIWICFRCHDYLVDHLVPALGGLRRTAAQLFRTDGITGRRRAGSAEEGHRGGG
mmetsp:Transcript_95657/g.219203  ORF Transcript_95657/g.219203 Transcript_95657/m.219203 type:complete len:113 (-) Transcript_95657:21-359(-)